MPFVIFYSWQSDMDSATNHDFIETALTNTANALCLDETITVEPVVDRDTDGVPGSPDIAKSIFDKIKACQLFIGDVSIINKDYNCRKTPNPNVLVELGYALSCLGSERVLLVMNKYSGEPTALPFDLKTRRIITYHVSAEAPDSSVALKNLELQLNNAIREVIKHHESVAILPVVERSLLDRATEAIHNDNPQQTSLVGDYMADLGPRLDHIAPDYNVAKRDGVESDEALVVALEQSGGIVTEFTGLVRAIASCETPGTARAIYEGFEHILERYVTDEPWSGSGARHYSSTSFDFYKFLGHEMFVIFFAALIKSNRWKTIGDLLNDKIYVERSEHGSSAFLHYSALSQPVRLLAFRNDRLKSGRSSFHADLLNVRHQSKGLAEAMRINPFVDADYFLWLRSVVTEEDINCTTRWWPASIFNLSGRTPRFLSEAERKTRADEIVQALGIVDLNTWRDRMRALDVPLHKLVPLEIDFFPMPRFNYDSLGSQP